MQQIMSRYSGFRRKEVTSMQFVAGFILGGLFGFFILCMFMQGSDDS